MCPFKCVIIGGGPERDDIDAAVKGAGLGGVVCLMGNVAPGEVYKYYLISDVFVFASKSETQGMVLLEAMAGGCPVVAVSSGGVNDVVSHELSGFVTEEDEAEWAGRVARLITDDATRNEMSAAAKKSVAGYSLQNMASAAVNSYDEAIKNYRRGKRGRYA